VRPPVIEAQIAKAVRRIYELTYMVNEAKAKASEIVKILRKIKFKGFYLDTKNNYRT
jgi:hypothetical protein